MLIRWVLLVFLSIPVAMDAQHPQLSRFVPGSYLTDNVHRVEIKNPTSKALSLSGYLLVTRDYSMMFPAGTVIPPRGNFVVAKRAAPGVDFQLVGTPNFLVRFHYLEHQGHYMALFSPAGQLLDAVYMSPSPNVPFLPDRDTLISLDGARMPFYLPPENRSDWQYVPVQSSRSTGYVKSGGKWKVEDKVVVEPVEFGNLIARYREGISSLKWTTRREMGCKTFWVEKSLDQQHFEPIGEETPKGRQGENAYSFYHDGLVQGTTAYYRIRAVDVSGRQYLSDVVRLVAEEVKEDFMMEVLPGSSNEVRIRIDSRFAQQVKMKLFTESFQEVAILFQDYVYANTPVLVIVTAELAPGHRYLVMATTEHGRFVRELVVDRRN